jgi:hypothetical protein
MTLRPINTNDIYTHGIFIFYFFLKKKEKHKQNRSIEWLPLTKEWLNTLHL